MSRRTSVHMGTFVTIEVPDGDGDERVACVERAFDWFRGVEETCTRFDPNSELMQLTSRCGVPVAVSPILYEAVRFALAVAHETGGAFDPTVGRRMESRGFNQHHRTGEFVSTTIVEDQAGATYRDVDLDPERRTITIRKPLVLDLGAVAKGLAVDMAARELQPCRNFAIDAGGDLYLAGVNAAGERWSVGIRHPRADGEWLDTIRVSDCAVCTSGDYERRSAHDELPHILDARTGDAATTIASATVIAPTALVADALATAAFVLGPQDGLRLLERQGVEGLLVTASLERHATRGFGRD